MLSSLAGWQTGIGEAEGSTAARVAALAAPQQRVSTGLKLRAVPVPHRVCCLCLLQDQDDELMDDMEFEDDFDSPAADY